jgi:transglycosylase-like protein with SLT domain
MEISDHFLSDAVDRRYDKDRRRRTDRRLLWRGVERRQGDRRRRGLAAGLVIAASLAAPKPVQTRGLSTGSTSHPNVTSSRPWDPGANRIVLTGESMASAATPKLETSAAVIAAATTKRPREQFDEIIAVHAALQGVRAELVRAVIQAESNFNPMALSSKGAMGLMQLMPGTAADLGVTNPFNPIDNIRGGTKYLRQLLDRYDNNETLAVAAYNAGPANVDKHGSRVPPFRETQEYVKRIMGSLEPPATATKTAAVRPLATKVIYKIVETIDGRSVPRYLTSKPESGPYEILKRG